VVLFGERGPAAASTRQIAARARVNNGLIHRFFGTKDALLRETMDRLAGEISAAVAPDERDLGSWLQWFATARERTGYWKLLARCLLDGKDPREFQSDFPTIHQIVDMFEALRERGTLPRELDPRVAAAAVAALGLGWLVFEPFLTPAAGLDDRDLTGVRRAVGRFAVSLVEGLR
jgi:AcrR family transcriptional regulator